jgi:protease-4
MGADSIMANGGTATGSIGVIMSYPVGKELLDKVGLNFQSIKSGELKDAGSFSREPSNADVNYFQELINDLHLQFVKSAAKERNMPLHQMEQLADGKVYSGLQAKELGLIDLIGTYEDAKNLIKSLLNTEKELKFIHPKHEEDGIFEYFLNSKNIELPFSNLNIFPIPEYRLYYGGRF